MKNWKTTIFGILAVAVQAILQAIAQGQIKLPELAPTALVAVALKYAKDAKSSDKD